MKAQSVYFVRRGKAELREVEVPDPSPDEVQVRCLANGICMGEVATFTGLEPREFPTAVGHEGIGVVTKVGSNVRSLQEGDYVDCRSWTSIQNLAASSVARFFAPPSDPACYIVEPPACVVIALKTYEISPGDRALVLGAGYMGLLNVQALAHCPLAELVVTDIKPRNLELARQFGATEAIRAGTPEGRARLGELKERPFDLVVEAAGVPETVDVAGSLTRMGGRLAIFAWHHERRRLDLGLWHMRGLRVLNSAPMISGVGHTPDSMGRAIRLLERGIFDQSELITHRHPAADVQEAMELAAERPEEYIKGVLLFEGAA